MTTKTFSKKLKKLIEDSGLFVTDTIDLTGMKKTAKQSGFDDLILVVGEDETESFMLHVQKLPDTY